tara:strand:+ start:37 stop:528 length:492 start_codon:yes stop_codon:yes gene_type:complete
MEKRAIWIVVVVLILCSAYYWVVVDSTRVDTMTTLDTSDKNLKGDVNEAVELWDRLDLRLRGTSKHVSTLQDSTRYHYKAYKTKVDSIDNSFDRIGFAIEQMNEVLSGRIDRLKDDLESLAEEVSSMKRSTNNSFTKLNKTLDVINSDIKKINDKLLEEFGDE